VALILIPAVLVILALVVGMVLYTRYRIKRRAVNKNVNFG